jgi:hypothetical protein
MLKQQPFGNSSGYRVDRETDVLPILTHLRYKFGCTIHSGTGVPDCYKRYDRRRCFQPNYSYMLQSTGKRYYMLLSKCADLNNYGGVCAFVEKSINKSDVYPKVILTYMNFDPQLYEGDGTVLDGEMIWRPGNGSGDSTENVFHVHDIWGYCGQRTDIWVMSKRLHHLRMIIDGNGYHPDVLIDPCILRVKVHVPVHCLRNSINNVSAVDYTVSAVIFKPEDPVESSYIYVQRRANDDGIAGIAAPDEEVEQTQPIHDISDDDADGGDASDKRELCMRRTNLPDVYELYDEQGMYIGSPAIITMASSQYVRSLFEDGVSEVRHVFCFSKKFGKWLPLDLK